MKQINLLLFLALSIAEGFSQNNIEITTKQTTCLVFPTAIRFVDRGSDAIATMQTKEAETLLLIKALKSNFTQTNLSVITRDGRLFNLIVRFDSLPTKMVYRPEASDVVFINTTNIAADINLCAEQLLHESRHRSLIAKRQWGITALLDDIHIKNGVFFFRLSLKNYSPIRYDLESLKLYITDLKNGKRTAIQEREISTIYTAGNVTNVDAGSTSHFVVATNKFTLSNGKYFLVEIRELIGGRHIKMKVRNRHLMRAKILN